MTTNLRWWGWGTTDRAFPADLAETVLTWLRDQRGFPLTEATTVPLERIALPEPRISLPAQQTLLEQVELVAGHLPRLTHAYGKGYIDLLRLRHGQVSTPPDVVALPTTVEQVAGTLRAAETHDVAVIPFGGGTSTDSSVEPVQHGAGTLALDLKGLNRLVNIDLDAGLATFEAGILGPDLHAILHSHGCSVAHLPASFEYSTLGGWIATRSVGHYAVSAGAIDDLIYDVEVILPNGSTTSTTTEIGQRLQSLWFGSHGTLGVITRATVRIRPDPLYRLFRTAVFADWEGATHCLHDLVGRNIRPAALELGDIEASQFDALFDVPDTEGFYRTRHRIQQWQFEDRSIMPQAACRLVMVFEGDNDDLSVDISNAERVVAKNGGVMASRLAAQRWHELKMLHPYLRDDLMDQSIGMDTVQTTTSWTNLPAVYGSVATTLRETLGDPVVLMGRIPHVWREGALLSFTWMAPQSTDDEVERWRNARLLACRAAANTGGTVDHHFAVPLDAEVIAQLETRPLTEIQRSLKRSLDVNGYLNPHKMGFESFDLHQTLRRPVSQP